MHSPRDTTAALLRLFDRTTPIEDCLAWTGCVDKDGYGLAKIDGRRWRVHRYVWAAIHDTHPAGLVLHSCDRPGRIRPEHLRLGTARENAADRRERRREERLYEQRWLSAGQMTIEIGGSAERSAEPVDVP